MEIEERFPNGSLLFVKENYMAGNGRDIILKTDFPYVVDRVSKVGGSGYGVKLNNSHNGSNGTHLTFVANEKMDIFMNLHERRKLMIAKLLGQ